MTLSHRRASAAMVRLLSNGSTLSVAEASRVFDDVVRRLPGGRAELDAFREHVQLRLMPAATGRGSPMPQRARRDAAASRSPSAIRGAGAIPDCFRRVERSARALLGVSQFNKVVSRCRQRVPALLTLMALQSASALVLGHFERMIEHNHIIPLFLTLVVGAGGNAGSQASTHFIDEATLRGERNGKGKCIGGACAFLRDVRSESTAAATIATIVGVCGFLRVLLSSWDVRGSAAIALSLSSVVFCAVIIGTALPSVLVVLGIDPVHSAPSIAVCMDIVGVALTCIMCSVLLPA